MAFPPALLAAPTQAIAQLLKSTKTTVSITETACGGLISACLLSVPGASSYYLGGLTLYTLPSRIAHAGWTEESIKGYKGPTTDVVLGLAKHNKETLKADFVLAESGTAGPTGKLDQRNRTPGFLALAVLGPNGYERAVEWDSKSADRTENMVAFAEQGMNLLKEALEQYAQTK